MKHGSNDDERDSELGAALRSAVEESLRSTTRAVPAARASMRLPMAAAAAIAIAGTAAWGGIAALRRGALEDAALGLTRSLLPERSSWVAEAMDPGTGPLAGETSLFVESLWAETAPF